ncbi:MAG TPA: BPSS1780 family membrane protein [Rhodocyclaceae bacterium]|nr:BPSS1780 family membrane protein [Rhodocyclaceae bacterium]
MPEPAQIQARRLPARHGFLWLLASFRLFRANPALITALTMAYVFVIVAVNLLPYVGPFLLPLALPALIVVLANGCRAVERGGGIGGVALTYGVRQHRVPLVRLGGLHLLGSIVILAASTIMEGGPPTLAGPPSMDEAETIAAMGRLMIIAIPVIAAFWFAPLLTAWDEVPPLKSVFFSFVASWRNWRAFAVFGATAALFAIGAPGVLLIGAGAVSAGLVSALAVVLKMALIFVMAPIMMASVYVSYQDVFHGEPAGE